MKKKLMSALLVVTMLAMVGCGNKTPDAPAPVETQAGETQAQNGGNGGTTGEVSGTTDVDANSLGGKFLAVFETEIAGSTDIEAICRKMDEVTEIGLDVVQVQEGFLNGFSGEVTGFKTGYTFLPFIGSIPLVGYIFETDDPEALAGTLQSLADPRWNICTEADQTVVSVSGNYVFFVMCPETDAE